MSEIYDLIILGGGPAGITAAIYAARARLHTLWLERNFADGGQVLNTYEVDNYPGMPGISGYDLGEAMSEHAGKLGISSVCEEICSVEQKEGLQIVCTDQKEYRSKTLIIAGGAEHKKLGIPGEEELGGLGVSYCATCDGAFFKDQTVVVVGGGNTAVEDAIFLARICKKVYVVHRREALRADKMLQEKLFSCENVEMVWKTVPVEILGTEQVTGVTVKEINSGEERYIQTDGVFVAVGIEPNTGVFQGLLKLNEEGYIQAGEDGVTSIPGVFAAGDIRTKQLRQIVTAVADGANAVFSAQKYLLKE